MILLNFEEIKSYTAYSNPNKLPTIEYLSGKKVEHKKANMVFSSKNNKPFNIPYPPTLTSF